MYEFETNYATFFFGESYVLILLYVSFVSFRLLAVFNRLYSFDSRSYQFRLDFAPALHNSPSLTFMCL